MVRLPTELSTSVRASLCRLAATLTERRPPE